MTEAIAAIKHNIPVLKMIGIVITILTFAGGTIGATLKLANAMEEANRGQLKTNHSIEMLRYEMREISNALDDIRKREELNTEFRLRSEGR